MFGVRLTFLSLFFAVESGNVHKMFIYKYPFVIVSVHSFGPELNLKNTNDYATEDLQQYTSSSPV